MNGKFLALLHSKVFAAVAISVAAVAAVGTAVIIATHNGSKTDETYRLIKVFELLGNGNVIRADVGDLDPYSGMNLENGDDVFTYSESNMRLTLDSDKFLLMEPDTEISLTASGDSDNNLTRIELKSGAVLNEIIKPLSPGSTYEVSSPKATMAVRGTSFRVYVEKDSDGNYITTLQVYHGTVSVDLLDENGNPTGEKIDVTEDQSVMIKTVPNTETGKDPIIDGKSFFILADGTEVPADVSPIMAIDYEKVPLHTLSEVFNTDKSNNIKLLDDVLAKIIAAMNGENETVTSQNDSETPDTTETSSDLVLLTESVKPETEITSETESETSSETTIETSAETSASQTSESSIISTAPAAITTNITSSVIYRNTTSVPQTSALSVSQTSADVTTTPAEVSHSAAPISFSMYEVTTQPHITQTTSSQTLHTSQPQTSVSTAHSVVPNSTVLQTSPPQTTVSSAPAATTSTSVYTGIGAYSDLTISEILSVTETTTAETTTTAASSVSETSAEVTSSSNYHYDGPTGSTPEPSYNLRPSYEPPVTTAETAPPETEPTTVSTTVTTTAVPETVTSVETEPTTVTTVPETTTEETTTEETTTEETTEETTTVPTTETTTETTTTAYTYSYVYTYTTAHTTRITTASTTLAPGDTGDPDPYNT